MLTLDLTVHLFVTFIECFERISSARHSCKSNMEFFVQSVWNFAKKSLD